MTAILKIYKIMLLKPCMVKENNTTIIEIESYPSAHIPLHLLPKIPRHSALHNPFYDQNRVFIRSTRHLFKKCIAMV